MAKDNYTTYYNNKKSQNDSKLVNSNPQMQGTKKIVITLKVSGSSSSSNNKESKEQKEAKKLQQQKNEAIASTGKQLLNFASSETINWAEYYINRTLQLNDDYIGQRQYTIAKQYLSYGKQMANSITQGASSLSVFGVPGMIIGGLIGAATTQISIINENARQTDQQNIQLRQMDTQLNFTRQRAGWSTTAASIGEDL